MHKCIIANTAPYGSMLHIPPTNVLPLAAKQEPYSKVYLLTKIIEESSEKKKKKFGRMDQQAEEKTRQKEQED